MCAGIVLIFRCVPGSWVICKFANSPRLPRDVYFITLSQCHACVHACVLWHAELCRAYAAAASAAGLVGYGIRIHIESGLCHTCATFIPRPGLMSYVQSLARQQLGSIGMPQPGACVCNQWHVEGSGEKPWPCLQYVHAPGLASAVKALATTRAVPCGSANALLCSPAARPVALDRGVVLVAGWLAAAAGFGLRARSVRRAAGGAHADRSRHAHERQSTPPPSFHVHAYVHIWAPGPACPAVAPLSDFQGPRRVHFTSPPGSPAAAPSNIAPVLSASQL